MVDRQMRTNLPDVLAAGDCVTTYHRLLGTTYLPLGTTAHKQGRIAGENALGGTREFAGSLGTQVVKVFELVAARTGLRDPHDGFQRADMKPAPEPRRCGSNGKKPCTCSYFRSGRYWARTSDLLLVRSRIGPSSHDRGMTCSANTGFSSSAATT